MRIIAGRFRSRRIKPVPGLNVRPTPDRLREALFNVLAPRINGTVFMDAYAGTGAVGIEALSRGARLAVLIEKKPEALTVLRENIHSLGIENEVLVIRGSATIMLPKYKCDIVFIDPPYEHVKDYGTCLNDLSETGCTLAIAQHASRLTLDDVYGSFEKTRVLRQGDNSLSFFEPA